MKVFKVIFNILQGFAAGYFCYMLFALSVLAGAIGGGSDPIYILLQSVIGIFFILGALMILTSIIGIFANKTGVVKTLSFINIVILIALALLSNFAFDLTTGIACGIIAAGNILLISLYNNKEKVNK